MTTIQRAIHNLNKAAKVYDIMANSTNRDNLNGRWNKDIAGLRQEAKECRDSAAELDALTLCPEPAWASDNDVSPGEAE